MTPRRVSGLRWWVHFVVTAVLFLGRFLVGVSVSWSVCADVTYLSEVSPPEYRGAVVSCNELMISLGVLVSYVIAFAFNTVPGQSLISRREGTITTTTFVVFRSRIETIGGSS
jgi:MFS family permease